ncbi:hypothetical protein [Granulicella tundricola]|uniref:hypothetical protein n=1 Tax=Granulicella tundricola TaxID=940615 RepID=UPI0002F99289|nr:hypothetical protein [Granulicella tundricola]
MSAPFRESLLWTGIGLGIATAAVTLDAQTLTTLSVNRFLATLQMIVLIPSFPGLFAAALTGSLAAGAAINLLFYWVLGGLSSLIFRKKDRSKAL